MKSITLHLYIHFTTLRLFIWKETPLSQKQVRQGVRHMKEKERAVNTDTSKEDCFSRCSSDTGDAYVITDIVVIVLGYGNAAVFIFL